jgi:hypothetical protein
MSARLLRSPMTICMNCVSAMQGMNISSLSSVMQSSETGEQVK